MSTSRILPRVIIILSCAFVGACAGTALQVLRLTGRPQEFRSLAKLVAGNYAGRYDITYQEKLKPFYGAIIESLGSSVLKRRALERVRAMHPELKDPDVEIRIAQTRSSSIFNILATAHEPKYTKIYLDALLDEFIRSRMNEQEQAFAQRHQSLIAELKNQQQEAEKASKALDDARSEVKTPESSAVLVRVKAAEESFEKANAMRSQIFSKVEQARQAFKEGAEYVAVQERATPASENIEDWTMPIVIGVIGGSMLGLVVGLLLSLIIVRSPRPPQIPAAL